MNDYLKEFNKCKDDDIYRSYSDRQDLVIKYAWAIPTPEAISLIAKYSPIIEVGAGTGYWASLISKEAKIECFDIAPPGLSEKNYYNHSIQHYPVLHINFLKWENTRNKTLFLCWPPYDSNMAIDSLNQYRGDTLIYIGEGHYGCTANNAFHEELDKNWRVVEELELPQWRGIHDRLEVHRR